MRDVFKIVAGIVVAAFVLFFGSAIVAGVWESVSTTAECKERGHQQGTAIFDACKASLKAR